MKKWKEGEVCLRENLLCKSESYNALSPKTSGENISPIPVNFSPRDQPKYTIHSVAMKIEW